MEIPSLDRETVTAVIAAAHAEGLAAVVHVSTLETALEAMAFGADGLVHVWRDEVVSEEDARRFAEADIFVVPTLSVMVSADDPAVAELVRETDEAMLSPIQRQTLAGRFAGGLAEGGEVAMENVRRLRAAGVRLVAGTDAPNPGTGTGISMHGELRLLARAGMGSAEALSAATSVAADAFGVAGARPDRRRPSRGPGAGARRPRGGCVAQPRHRRDLEGRVSGGSCGRLRRGRGSGRDRARPRGNPGRGLRGRVRGELRRMGRDDGPTHRRFLHCRRCRARRGAGSHRRDRRGSPLPWAGVIWMPGAQPMQPVDFSGRETIRFRDEGGWAAVLGDADRQRGAGRAAAHRDVHRAREWTRVEIRLEDFPTATPEVIAGLAFVAEGRWGGSRSRWMRWRLGEELFAAGVV